MTDQPEFASRGNGSRIEPSTYTGFKLTAVPQPRQEISKDETQFIRRISVIPFTILPTPRLRGIPLPFPPWHPKLVASPWQLYLADWISRHQTSIGKKVDIVRAFVEAGREYARLSSEEKEVCLNDGSNPILFHGSQCVLVL